MTRWHPASIGRDGAGATSDRSRRALACAALPARLRSVCRSSMIPFPYRSRYDALVRLHVRVVVYALLLTAAVALLDALMLLMVPAALVGFVVLVVRVAKDLDLDVEARLGRWSFPGRPELALFAQAKPVFFCRVVAVLVVLRFLVWRPDVLVRGPRDPHLLLVAAGAITVASLLWWSPVVVRACWRGAYGEPPRS